MSQPDHAAGQANTASIGPNKLSDRPGWDLPIRHWNDDGCVRSVDTVGPMLTQREVDMMALVNSITDKPEWQRKVLEDDIVARWRSEAVPKENTRAETMSAEVFEWCITELREKAKLYEKQQFVNVFDTEYTAAKSDVIVSEALRAELKDACQRFYDLPESARDYHPGSNNQVFDHVHPSLFPLVYGRSRVLESGTVPLKDCSTNIGKGKVLPSPPAEKVSSSGEPPIRLWSMKYQWLPSEICFLADGRSHIDSYINNLHPMENETLYAVLEKFVDAALPMWSACLPLQSSCFAKDVDGTARIECDGEGIWDPPEVDWEAWNTWKPTGDDEEDEEHNPDADWRRVRQLVQPNPKPYEGWKKCWPTKFSLREQFRESGLQVIFKLASIELTPDSPEYAGGSWHVEGQRNENIAATALYYYDCDNISESRLHFRQQISWDVELQYPQNDHEGLWKVFNWGEEDGSGDEAIQGLGSAVTRQGRMLVFPNNYQHRVAPFSLVDRTKKGHRRFLVMWLIDPWNRVLSTANVPPQQRDWWTRELVRSAALPLPAEIAKMAADAVNDFPISLEEAKEIRVDLMAERTAFRDSVDKTIGEISLCEH